MQAKFLSSANRKRAFILVVLASLMLASLVIPAAVSHDANAEVSNTCEGEFISISQPLNDLGTGEYVRLINGPTGFTGGLYPGGSNVRPAAHETAGVALANQVEPLDSDGQADPENGRIVMVSIGMSNTEAEFDGFIGLAESDDAINPRLTIINGAQSGRDSQSWAFLGDSWQVLDQRIRSAGVSPLQVQVAWIKQARAISSPPGTPNFPEHAQWLEQDLEAISRNLLTTFPNIKLTFLSSRTRAYAYWRPLNPEPFAFETGFSVKWLIERQINGDRDLNFDPSRGDRVVPYLSWGPYLWADGLNPRSDGLIWTQEDLKGDCIHPSDNGVLKVANQLMAFFEKDTAAAPWFLADYSPPPPTETPPPPIVTPPPDLPNDFYLPLNVNQSDCSHN